jgi:MFS family permease
MNRSLLWLGIALFTWGVGETMFFVFQPIYLQHLGANPLAIGGILGASGLVMTLVHIPSGHLSDRWGRKPMLVGAWMIGIVSGLTMALAKSLTVFIIGVLLYAFTAFVISPLDSYLTAARGNWSVARAITFSGICFNAGAVIGPFAGGWVGDHYGLRTVYFIVTGIFVFSTLFIFLVESQPQDHHDLADPPAGLMTNWRLLGFLSIYFLVALFTYLPQPLTPNFLENQRGLSLTQIGALGSIGGIGNTTFNFLLGMLEARAGFLLGQLGVMVYALLLWKGTEFGWFAVAYFLLGGFRVLRGLGIALVRPFVHESQMGLAYGLAETLGSSTILIAPPIAGYLYSRDPFSVYPIGLVGIGIGLLISLVFVPRAKRIQPEHIELTHEP